MQQTDPAAGSCRPWVSAVLSCTVAAAGAIAGWLHPSLLPYWPGRAWRQLGGNWLFQHGYDRLAGNWALVWVHMPRFLLAMLLGAFVGLLLPRRWFRSGVVCGLGLVIASEAWCWVHGVTYYQIYGYVLITPYEVAPVPILLLVAWLASRLRPAPVLPGHCRTCGYDLTGNVSGLCPECGTRLPPVPTDVPNLPNEERCDRGSELS